MRKKSKSYTRSRFTTSSSKTLQSVSVSKVVSTKPNLPSTNDYEAWKQHWRKLGQSWRVEPEINEERKTYLENRRLVKANIRQSIFPFNIKLSRADIEWLLVTHEDGRGPVDWKEVNQRERKGLDLRGADLREVDLSNLPLARMIGGLDDDEFKTATRQQFTAAKIHLEKAYLSGTHLEGSILYGAYLNQANLREAHLEKADLKWAHLERAILTKAFLEGTDLRNIYFDSVTNLDGIILGNKEYGFVMLANVHWGDANISVVDWEQVKIVGDEHIALQSSKQIGKKKQAVYSKYEDAIRANRQLALILQRQGLNEEAAYFIYRALKLQRKVKRYKGKYGQYLFSLFLDVLAGYGYLPQRSLMIYLCIIISFALGYYELTHLLHAQPYPLLWYEALVLSVSSFHGRGFFQTVDNLGDPVAILASIEAIMGLLVEISFIATFTQRYFGK